MRIHHLDCGTMCPFGGRLMDGESRGIVGHLVCHCLLVESDRGLILVDTGFGSRDVEHPYPRLSRLYMNMLRVKLDPERTARRQIERLGFSAADVGHIVLTHLDFDHAGGLEDFPQATVHVTEVELQSATARHGFVGRRRYRPMQWDEITTWRRYSPGGEPWMGFPAVRGLDGLPPEILLIPLPGHTHGHSGVAIDTGSGWLLDAGDAYFFHREVRQPERECPPGLRGYQRLMEVDRRARLANQERLRRLSLDKSAAVRMFCSHDAHEFVDLARAPQRALAGAHV